MNLGDIKAAVVERLRDVDGVRPFAFDPDEPPAGQGDVVAIRNDDTYIEYQQAFSGGLGTVNLVLRLYIAASDLRPAHARMDALLSSGTGEARSLIDVLMGSDRTYGGLCSDLCVDRVDNVDVDTVMGATRYLTCDIALRVLVSRT